MSLKAKRKRVQTGTDTYHDNKKYRDGSKVYKYDTSTEKGKKKYQKRIEKERLKAKRKNKKLEAKGSKSRKVVLTPDDGSKSLPSKNSGKVKYKQPLLNRLRIN